MKSNFDFSTSTVTILASFALAIISLIEPCFSPRSINILFISLLDLSNSKTAFLPYTISS